MWQAEFVILVAGASTAFSVLTPPLSAVAACALPEPLTPLLPNGGFSIHATLWSSEFALDRVLLNP